MKENQFFRNGFALSNSAKGAGAGIDIRWFAGDFRVYLLRDVTKWRQFLGVSGSDSGEKAPLSMTHRFVLSPAIVSLCPVIRGLCTAMSGDADVLPPL